VTVCDKGRGLNLVQKSDIFLNGPQRLHYQNNIQRHLLMILYVLASSNCYCLTFYILFSSQPSYVIIFYVSLRFVDLN